jgi:hypothetical protein
MTSLPARAGGRPLPITAVHHPMADHMGSAVTSSAVAWLGAPLAMADAAERTARSWGGARG